MICSSRASALDHMTWVSSCILDARLSESAWVTCVAIVVLEIFIKQLRPHKHLYSFVGHCMYNFPQDVNPLKRRVASLPTVLVRIECFPLVLMKIQMEICYPGGTCCGGALPYNISERYSSYGSSATAVPCAQYILYLFLICKV